MRRSGSAGPAAKGTEDTASSRARITGGETAGERKLELKKSSLVRFLDDCGGRGNIPRANLTLTSSAWPYGGRHQARTLSLPGDSEFRAILAHWGLDVPTPIHLGFEFLLERPDSYPLFHETFRSCGWDTVGPGLDWGTWTRGAIAEFGAAAWDRVSAWASGAGCLDSPTGKDAERFRLLRRGRTTVARLYGRYGVGGPLLDLRVRQGDGRTALPEG